MAGLIDIFNGALSRLGIRAVTGEEDNRQEVLFCRANARQTMDQVLEAGEFSFSLKRSELTELSESVYGFNHVFILPSDLLHVCKVEPEDERWQIIGSRFCTDASKAVIEYVRRGVNADEFSPWAAECVSVLLASKLAVLCTNTPTLSGEFLREYMQVTLPSARREDNLQKQLFRGRKYWCGIGEEDRIKGYVK